MAYKAEDIDFESYLNLNNDFTSPNLSNINKGKGIAPIQYQQPPIEKINTYAPLQNSQMFSGPSHQYDQHKQHIPLPPGALKSITAIPQPGYQFNGYPNYGMGSNTTSFFDVSDDFVDFSGMNGGHRPSFGGSNDIDMDFDSPVDMGYSGGSEFVDPNSIEDSPVPARAEVVRVYPGMHAHQAQQAALAKQQQQMEIQRQRQIKVASQPQQQSSHKPSASRGGNKEPLNPAQEAKISQILSQMRQDIKLPTNHNGDDQSPPSMMRSKKDEEDMDEDERLLASEEGKKLSSKERRQLRNKVSARAFRSRRKEYIGQLEEQIAAKSTEADTLRAENEALKAENTRLTDLTKLLLGSNAFSAFLNDLSTNGVPASIAAPAQPTESVTPQPEPQQSQSQVPTPQPQMETIVESDIDFNALGADSNWNTGMDFTFGGPTQVFAVFELPEGPIIEPSILSGKSAVMPSLPAAEKETVPVISAAPVPQESEREFVCDESVVIDTSDSSFDLFIDAPSTCPPSSENTDYEVFGTIPYEKATETYELIVRDEIPAASDEFSAAALARFEGLCASLDSLSLRIDSHMLN